MRGIARQCHWRTSLSNPQEWRQYMQVKPSWITATAAIAFACQVPAQEMTVKIGHVAPMSGWMRAAGTENENGVRLAIDQLHAKGVTIGGQKVRFELVPQDDGADPARSTLV